MSKKGGGEAARAREDEQARQQRIRTGTERVNTIFSQNFNDDFFGGRRQAFMNFATPQLDDQYAKASNELTFSLARSGMLDSSTRAQRFGELQRLYDTNKQQVADQAMQEETQARNQVEDARGNLISMLNATGDAEGAANSAITRATALSRPNAFSPLSNLFGNFTNTLGMQAAQERAAAASGGQFQPRYNTGLFGNSGAVRTYG
jgi:hypothetical protein